MKNIIHIVRSPEPVEIAAVSGRDESYYPIIDYYHRLDEAEETYQKITIEAVLEELKRMEDQI